MINRNLMGRTAEDDYSGQDLSEPPVPDLPVDPVANSTAMLGSPEPGTGEVSPEEAGPAASLAFLGMMVQGAQGLSTSYPGFVPMEIIAWLQGAMQQLPQMIQQSQMGAGASGLGMGGQSMMGGGTAALGIPPSMQSGQSSGPPRPY